MEEGINIPGYNLYTASWNIGCLRNDGKYSRTVFPLVELEKDNLSIGRNFLFFHVVSQIDFLQ